jgi:hypothetical protein
LTPPVISFYYALSGLGDFMAFIYTGRYPVLRYVALSGLGFSENGFEAHLGFVYRNTSLFRKK